MSLGTTNPYHAVWPVFGGNSGFGDCSCNAAGGAFYDVLALGGGHGGDDASLTRDFATPPRLLFLVGEFEEMINRLWNDDTVDPSWTATTIQTSRIAKIWTRDTGAGVYHPQVDQLFAESAGFTNPPARIIRNWQEVGAGGTPPCELFVYGGGSYLVPPTALVWSVPQRVISGTTYAAESVSSPVHKLLVGGASWKGEDYFQSPATSFRFPGYGTPGTAHDHSCTLESFAAGKRGSDRELWFQDGFGGATSAGGIYAVMDVNIYNAAGSVSYTMQSTDGTIFGVKPFTQEDYFVVAGNGPLLAPGGINELTLLEANGTGLAAQWPGNTGGIYDTNFATDVFVYPTATNAAGGYVDGDIVALRQGFINGLPQPFDWDGANGEPFFGGIRVASLGGTAYGGQSWSLWGMDSGNQQIWDCDADGRIYFGGGYWAQGGTYDNGTDLYSGGAVDSDQLYRVDKDGANVTTLGTFYKNGVQTACLGFVVVCDPVYGGAGISHGIAVGDFDEFRPPASASDTTPKTGLSGIAVISLRDSQTISQQQFWSGRFGAGDVTVDTGDWLPGLVLPT